MALAVSRGVGKLPIATSRRLPIESFPARLGEWQTVLERTPDPATRRVLATATTVDRRYVDGAGRTVDLLLLTATRTEDFHNPQSCFPSQGWHLEPPKPVTAAGRVMSETVATQGSVRARALYCWVGDYRADLPHPPAVAALYRLRGLIDREKGASLFVRMMAPDTPEGRASLRTFAASVWAWVGPMLARELPGARTQDQEGKWRRK